MPRASKLSWSVTPGAVAKSSMVVFSLMGVGDFLDGDDRDAAPIPTAIVHPRLGVVPGGENKAVGVVEVGGKLVFEISFKLVDAGLGKVSEIFEAARRLEFRDPSLETSGPIGSELSLSLFPVGCQFFEFPVAVSNLHRGDGPL
jgi:hypothetical protein